MKILIIQRKHMGDVLVSSTILQQLKKKFPEAEINFLVDSKHQQILFGNPLIKNIILWNEKEISNMISMVWKIRRDNYDIIIDSSSKVNSGIITLVSNAKKRIGFFKKYTQFFYNFPIKRKDKTISKNTTLSIEHRLQLLEPLDISFQEIFPKTYILDEELLRAKQVLSKNGLSLNDNLIMISSFGSKEEKTYPIEYMARILDYIVNFQNNAKLLCNYLPHQKELFLQIYDLVLPETQQAIVENFDTKNLREFAAVTSLCKCLIGNEGGATNLSKSLGIPTFSIFAPHVSISDWGWTSQPDLDMFLHLSDFLPNSFNYADFKPEFLEKQLNTFLEKVILEKKLVVSYG